MKRIADLTCPECQKAIQVPFEEKEAPTLDEINSTLNDLLKGHPTADQVRQVIQEQIAGLKPPAEAHQHKTFDELYECPGCKPFVETAARYQVTAKEPEKAPEPDPETTEPAIGSIFSKEV